MRSLIVTCLLLLISFPSLADDKPIITVLDFKTDGVSDKEMRSLISRLSTDLFNTEKFILIDVTQRDTLLKEVEFSASDCTDEACQLRIGKMLSAGMVVVGNIGKLGSRFLISVRMLETETARTVRTADGTYPSLDAMVDDLPNLSAKLAGMTPKTGTAFDLMTIGKISSFVVGLGAGAVGGYLLLDFVTNGKRVIDQARSDYEKASAAEAGTKWNALNEAVEEMRNKYYLGIGLAAGGILFTGLGTILAIIPRGGSVAVNIDMVQRMASLSASFRY